MAEIKTLWETNKEKYHYTKIFEYNGRKFMIQIMHENSAPLGFNFQCALSVMTSDGYWKSVADNKTVGFQWVNCYCDGAEKRARENVTASVNFETFVKHVY